MISISKYELLTILIGVAGVIVAFVSLVVRTNRLDKRQQRLQEKQEELTDLQLELLRRAVYEADIEKTVGADVRVTLEKLDRQERFLITNWGYGSAKNVALHVEPRHGHTSPLVQGDFEEKLPIPELLPGARLSLLAALSFGTGTVFDATWSWTDPDGSQKQRQGQISLL